MNFIRRSIDERLYNPSIMKALFIAGLLACAGITFAQTKIEKRIPVQPGNKVEMNFDYPRLIKVHSWEKNEILIQGSVSINKGENDEAFEISTASSGQLITISSHLKNEESIPRRIVIVKGDQEYYFRTSDPNDPAIRKFTEEQGGYTSMNTGIIRDITLEIYVPKGMVCQVSAKFGMVEVTGFEGPLSVNAKFGGVDITIPVKTAGQVIARTKFGEILTNLDAKFQSAGDERHGHWTEIQAKLGNGPSYEVESAFGKVYLRKP
jgi:hypothetical protein